MYIMYTHMQIFLSQVPTLAAEVSRDNIYEALKGDL